MEQVHFVVDGEHLIAARFALERSPYFKNLFKYDKPYGVIKLDVDVEKFKEVLNLLEKPKYLYPWSNAEDYLDFFNIDRDTHPLYRYTMRMILDVILDGWTGPGILAPYIAEREFCYREPGVMFADIPKVKSVYLPQPEEWRNVYYYDDGWESCTDIRDFKDNVEWRAGTIREYIKDYIINAGGYLPQEKLGNLLKFLTSMDNELYTENLCKSILNLIVNHHHKPSFE